METICSWCGDKVANPVVIRGKFYCWEEGDANDCTNKALRALQSLAITKDIERRLPS